MSSAHRSLGRRSLDNASFRARRLLEHTSVDEFRKLLNNDSSVYLRRWSRDRALAIPKFVFLRLRPELLGVRTAEDSL